ncbi:MAG: FAD-dependent oxidoreductase, partial [Myxococcaceae bacterium]
AVSGDEQELHVLMGDLERAYGSRYRVLGASSVREALETLRRSKFGGEVVALLLVDHRLPESSGLELLEQARTVVPEAKRVLLVTFADAQAVIGAVKNARIDHYVVKPWQPPDQNLYPALNDLLTGWEAGRSLAAGSVLLVGYRFSPRSHETRDFCARHCVPFRWLDIERDPEARRLLGASGVKAPALPVVIFPDGTQLVQPTNAAIAEKIGLKVRPEGKFYDLVIVGSGPAGLAASVYGASEGLRTVMIERHAPGGQAALSSMIENYLGFPAGLSGSDLARRGVAQARKFGVEIVAPQTVTRLRADGSSRVVTLSDDSELSAHVVLLTPGVQWRRLDVPGIERLTGAGVYYGGTPAEALFCRGEDVYIVGGANSAGQAALFFARYARTVTMLVREDTLARSMSKYLVDQIEATSNVRVRLQTVVVGVEGETRLEAITVRDTAAGKEDTVPATALFIFIGAEPHTEWLDGVVERDRRGYVVTGPDLARLDDEPGDGTAGRPRDWTLEREPYRLESSVPGIFAAGDVRSGSVKRVAAGVGEGVAAVQFIHQYLASTRQERR